MEVSRTARQEKFTPLDAILLAGSFTLGALVSGVVTYQLGKKKLEEHTLATKQKLSQLEQGAESERRRLAADAHKKAEEQQAAVASIQSQLSIREGEIELAREIEAAFAACASTMELWQACDALPLVVSSFANSVPFCSAFMASGDLIVELPGELSPERAALQALVIENKTESTRILSIEENSPLRRVRADVTHVVLLPVNPLPDYHAVLAVAVADEDYQETLRLLKKVQARLANELRRILVYETEVRASRIDVLTGLPNKKSLSELLPKLIRRANDERQLSCLVIECDNIKAINDKYGHLVGDQLINQLVETIHTSRRIEELNSDSKSPDYLIRYGGLQFMLLMEETDTKTALVVAERIRTAVESKSDWAGGVPTWSVSIGIATAPEDSTEGDMLFLRAEVALMYVKEKLGINHSIAFSQVPRSFRVSKLSAKVDGSLDVFDPATILQSFVFSDKTGILTVNANDGRKFWAFIDHRKMQKAYMGQFKSDHAVIEFLSTFDDGQFAFNEYNTLDADALEELHRMDSTFDTPKPLEKYLLDGALAQDKLSSARRLITNARLFVKPMPDAAMIVAGLPGMKDGPDGLELNAMHSLLKHVNGRTMLTAIFDRIDNYPTYVRWHAASLLIQHGVVDLTKLAMTFSL